MYKIELIEINRILNNPFQPRKHFDSNSIVELANSISKIGLLQPIIVNINNKNEIKLIAGQRRLETYKKLNKRFIECLIIPGNASEKDFTQASIIENIQREEMSSYDTALSLKELKDNGMTLQEISEQIGKSLSWISKSINALSLGKLNLEIQEKIEKGNLEISKAALIASEKKLTSNEKCELVKEVIEGNLTKKELENKLNKKEFIKNADWLNLESNIQRKLGTKITIQKNKLTIMFLDKDDLNRILEEMSLI
ncbi:ParB/RepB/Spo0J family partition protein [Spiroplasma endosymbiont of Diplazon laetatorius]|uniref:ParB/RepB/Spo0J family partition protein n=1 Tax=Spiroplasma endosymbiont of Diplazon laetatorius TaxID=3066322 RepID=UPI0030D1B6DB